MLQSLQFVKIKRYILKQLYSMMKSFLDFTRGFGKTVDAAPAMLATAFFSEVTTCSIIQVF